MTTLNELAESLGTRTDILREFAPDDITRDMTSQTEIPAEAESMIREAWAAEAARIEAEK